MKKNKKYNLKIGERFNRLSYIGPTFFKQSKDGGNISFGVWKCDCGAIKDIGMLQVIKGRTKSCGCIRKDKIDPEKACIKMIFYAIKSSAKKRSLNFNLTLEDVTKLIKQKCTYCGYLGGNYRNYGNYKLTFNGVDRIDSKIGYEIDNSVSCCPHCNLSKRSLSTEDFFFWLNRVWWHQLKKRTKKFKIVRSFTKRLEPL